MLALYQWQVTGQSPSEIGSHFFSDPIWMGEVADPWGAADDGVPGDPGNGSTTDLFDQLLKGVPRHSEIRPPAAPLDRRVERRPGRAGHPAAVLTNWCTARKFPRVVIMRPDSEASRRQGHRYINGVLDGHRCAG
jgi:hypothetical protein